MKGPALLPLTLTHARIRAAQGDVRGARSIVRALLRERPDDPEARALLEALWASAQIERVDELEPHAAPPVAAETGQLAARFRRALGRPTSREVRIRRLTTWLARVTPASRV